MTASRLPEGAQAKSLRRRVPELSADTWGLLIVAGGVIMANLPFLLGIFDPNPLGPRSSLVSAATAGIAGGTPTLDPNNGFISQAVSHRAVLDLLHFHLPWWNPYEGTGVPLAGGLQAAAFFPPTLLTGFSNGQLYEHILLELVGGIATYRLLRRLELVSVAAVAGGIAFGLNGTFAWFSHATVNPVAFLPVLLLGIERAYSAAATGRKGDWWLIAVAGILSFYAGFPEVTYIDTVLAICWFGWRFGCLPSERRRALVMKGAAGVVTALLVAAPLLIAMLDYTAHGDIGAHGGTYFGNGHIPAQGLPQLLMPYIYGPIFAYQDPHFTLTAIWYTVGGFLSTSLLLFGVLGLFTRGRRALRAILLVWAILVVARTYGAPPVLASVLGWLPGMSRVAFFRYATSSLEMAVVVLAALAIDDLARRQSERRRVIAVGAASLVVLAIAGVAAHPLAASLGSRFSHRPYFVGSLAWGALVLLGAMAVTVLVQHRRAAVLAAALVAIDALALFAVPEASAPRAVTVDTGPPRFLQAHLGTDRAFTLGPLAPNYGSYFGVATLNINDVPVPSALTRYIHTQLDPVVNPEIFVGSMEGGRSPFAPTPQQELIRHLDAYRAAAVRYVLAPVKQPLPQTGSTFRLVARTPTTLIYRLAGTRPYFDAGARCNIVAPGRDTARVTCAQPATLIRRETYMPGWTATIDGRARPVHQVNGLFQSVTVPAGSHTLRFEFAPPYIEWGYVAFAAGVLTLLLPGIVRRLRGRPVTVEDEHVTPAG